MLSTFDIFNESDRSEMDFPFRFQDFVIYIVNNNLQYLILCTNLFTEYCCDRNQGISLDFNLVKCDWTCYGFHFKKYSVVSPISGRLSTTRQVNGGKIGVVFNFCSVGRFAVPQLSYGGETEYIFLVEIKPYQTRQNYISSIETIEMF